MQIAGPPGIVQTLDGVITIGDESITAAQLGIIPGVNSPRVANFNQGVGGLTLFTTAALSAPRTVPLPAAGTLSPGTHFRAYDIVRGVTAVNTLTFTLSGTDTHNGGAVSPAVNAPGGSLDIVTDGVSRWTTAAVGAGGGGSSPQNNPKNTAVNTVGAATLPAAAVDGDLVTRGGVQIANFTDTTDTAANIITALGGAPVGTSWYVDVLNTTTFQETVGMGAGVTALGSKMVTSTIIIAPNCFAHCLFTYTAAGAVSCLLEYVDDLGIDNLNAAVDPGVTNDNTQGYGPGSQWINTTANRQWMCFSAATGAAVWGFGGASYTAGGSNPANEVTQFGSGTGLLAEEGNINRQVFGIAGQVNPGATGADNVVAVYSLPANSLDGLAGTNRGLTITAVGSFAANANTKRPKLWWNPSTAVVGSTIGAGGTLLADTGAVTNNGGSWWLGGNVFKRGAAGSNTQTCTSNGAIAGGSHTGISAVADATAVETGAILIAVTVNNTTAVGDAGINWFEVNAMN